MEEWDAAGLRWTQWHWCPGPWCADLGHSEFTDAGRTECGFHDGRSVKPPPLHHPRRTAQAAGTATPLAAYTGDAATAISARMAELADSAIRHRPPWMSLLGQ
jgi:hypothetical protein